MTEVAFHFNVPERVTYLCRLLRKVRTAGMTALVVLPGVERAALDQALWTFSPADFLPHASVGAGAEVMRRSPLVLAEALADVSEEVLARMQVLVNGQIDAPEDYERFARVIEIVGRSDEERVLARQRWRHYTARGHEIVRHDLSAVPA